jgi:spore coat protein CotH
MAVSDEELWSEMSQVVNMDYLITFAVIEALVGHVDGFTGYQNNVYFYQNPDDQLLYFIPWGADQAFHKQYIVISNDNTPASVLLGNYLMQRLWQSEQFRVSYDLRLQEILDTVWNEVELVAMADKLALIAGANDIEVAKIREFILERRSLVEAELDGLADREGQWVLLPPLSEPAMVCAETD